MQGMEEHPFEKGINIARPRKYSPEFACAVLFYISVLSHVVISIIIFASKNTEPMTITGDNGVLEVTCPSGMMSLSKCATSSLIPMTSALDQCVTQDLCDEMVKCQQGTSRRLALTREDVPDGVWEFLEQHFYQPTVLFSVVFILAAAWLFALQKAPKLMVWGTIGADVAMLVAIFIWFLVEEESINWACIVLVALMAIGCAVLYKKINMAAVMMKYAMDGLFANKRLFGVCFGVQLLWVAFFALWVAALIDSHFVKTAKVNDEGRCELQNTALASGGMVTYMVLHYYWVTYFLRNVNVYVIASNVTGWYFKEEGYQSFWIKGLQWAFGPLAGGNAIASAIMGFLEYLLSKVGSTWKLVFAMLNPFEWIFLCIGLCMKTIAQTYTKFGVIAQTVSGQGFCATAPKALWLLRNWLGEVVVCDYVGKRVLSWMTYALSLGIAFAAWAWADEVQEISSFGKLPAEALFPVTIAFAWILSQPFLGLLIVVFIEQLLSGILSACGHHDEGCLEVRAVFNGIFAALFMGCVTFFILTFLSQVVVTAMDVCLFCYAVESDLQLKDGEPEPARAAFYDAVKTTVVVGNVKGQEGVVQGNPAGGATPPPQMMMVQVPPGGQAGQTLAVATPDGRQIQVQIPAGVAEGQTFQVQVPAPEPVVATTVTGNAVVVAPAPA